LQQTQNVHLVQCLLIQVTDPCLQDGASGGAPRWGGSFDAVMLDDCNFHESVSLDRFEAERMLELVPPDGEFALMQYRYIT
jgi:Adaptor complexes medium subunit family